MAIPQWFDLYDYDAKIERIREGVGVFKLRLELPPVRVQDIKDIELLDAGWVEEDLMPNGRRVFVNERTMLDTRSMGEALGIFFSRDELRTARAPQDAMRQEEKLDGLKERSFVEPLELSEQIAMVDGASRDRIMKSVAAAAAEQKKRLAAERGNLLDGRGVEVFGAIVDELEAQNPGSELRSAIQAMSLLTDFAVKREGTDPRGSTEYDLARRLLKAIDQEDDAEREQAVKALAAGAVMRPGGLLIMGEGLEKARPRDVALLHGLLRGSVPVSMMGGFNVNLDERNSIDSVLRKVPFAVVRDNSMQTRELANYAAAVSRATEFVADRLGMPVDDLMPDQDKVPLRFNVGSVLVGSGASGVVRSSNTRQGQEVNADGDRQRNAVTIAVSLRQPGAFVHELGHAIAKGNMLTAQNQESLLERAGLLQRIRGEIGRHYDDDNAYGKYLRSADEIFARVFEASMVNHAISKGDHGLKSLGGAYAVHSVDHFAARGDLEATSEFLAGLTEELKAKRNRAYEIAGEKSRTQAKQEDMAPAQPPEPAMSGNAFGLN
jgi:hypothetical protein